MNSNSILQDTHFRRRPANLLHRTETHVPSHHIQHWIAGQAVNSADNATFSTQRPDDNETYSKTCSAATSEVAAAVAAAEEAAESFRQTLPDERESILLQAAAVQTASCLNVCLFLSKPLHKPRPRWPSAPNFRKYQQFYAQKAQNHCVSLTPKPKK